MCYFWAVAHENLPCVFFHILSSFFLTGRDWTIMTSKALYWGWQSLCYARALNNSVGERCPANPRNCPTVIWAKAEILIVFELLIMLCLLLSIAPITHVIDTKYNKPTFSIWISGLLTARKKSRQIFTQQIAVQGMSYSWLSALEYVWTGTEE